MKRGKFNLGIFITVLIVLVAISAIAIAQDPYGMIQTGQITETNNYLIKACAGDYADNKYCTSVTENVDVDDPIVSDDYYASYGYGWINHDAEVTITASDVGSGLRGVYYCEGINCIPDILLSIPYKVFYSAEQNTIARYKAVDNAGRESNIGEYNVKIDKTPPLTTHNYAYDNIWTNKDALITLTVSDNLAGVKETVYCVDFGDCIPNTVGNIISITTDGSFIVKYHSIDNANNIESIKSLSVKIDKTPPTAPVLQPLPLWNTNGIVSLQWTTSDASISGLNRYEVWRASQPAGGIQSEFTKITELQTLTFTDSGLATDTTYTYKIVVYDNAGNYAESNTVSTTVDTINPYVEIINPLSNQIISETFITVLANYANTYLVNCQVKLDDGMFFDMNGDNQVSGTAYYSFGSGGYGYGGEPLWGLHNFTVKCVDEAGNVAFDYALNVIFDNIPPETAISCNNEACLAEWYTTKPIAVDLICSDTGSGCKATYYCIDSSNTCTPNIPYISTIAVSNEGINHVRFYSVDVAGNAESIKSQMIKIDTVAPTIVDDYTYDGIWVNSDQLVTLTPFDSISGINKVKYCIVPFEEECVPDTILTSPYKLSHTTEQNSIVRYQATDNAGLTSNIGAYNVKIDKTTPVTIDDNVYNNEWTNLGNNTITLTASDNLAGIRQIDYSINDAPYTSYSDSVAMDFFADGVFNIKYHATDNANNVETEKSTIIKLDATPPLVNITVTPKSWYNCAAGGFFFWLVFFIDGGEVAYPVVHGCVEVNADIDASISGLNNYKIKIYDQNNELVAESTNSEINFNFVTSMNSYKIVVEALDNANNYATETLIIYEDDDEDLVPDILDLCPTIKPSVDENHDGCPDEPGVPGYAWGKCVDIYTGKAITSIYPVANVINVFTGETFVKGSTIWYGMNSNISNVYATSYMNIKVRDNTVTTCEIDLRQFDSVKELSKKKHFYTLDKDIKIQEENITNGNYNLQEIWKFDLSDGSKIRANTHYNMNRDESKVHVTYENKIKEAECLLACDNGKKSCLNECNALPKAQQKTCISDCNKIDVSCQNLCRDTFSFNIMQEYSGMKTLSLYDILVMIGYA